MQPSSGVGYRFDPQVHAKAMAYRRSRPGTTYDAAEAHVRGQLQYSR
jgi:hypothetical protein